MQNINFETIIHHSPEAIILANANFEFVYANDQAQKLLGLENSPDSESFNGFDFIPEQYLSVVKSTLTTILKTRKVKNAELYICDKNKNQIPIEVTISIYQNGSPYFQLIFKDISKRKKLEEEKNQLVAAVQNTFEHIVITNAKGEITYVNNAFEKVTGYKPNEILGKNPNILQSGEHNNVFYKNLWETLTSGKVWSGKFINKRKNGDIFHESATITPLKDEHGKITNYVAVKRDITDDYFLNKKMRQAQKMEALGTLAGGIAHDFNNILTPILGHADMALYSVEKDSMVYKDLEKILNSAKRAQNLVQQIVAFNSPDSNLTQIISIKEAVSETVDLLRASLPSTITLNSKMPLNNILIKGDSNQIKQLLINVCNNSHEAMGDFGKIVVKLEKKNLSQTELKQLKNIKNTECATLTISDNGPGIEAQYIDRIFDPFFTTKGMQEGLGMGLAVVHGIITAHKADVSVTSSPKGTTIKFYFPLANDNSTNTISELSKVQKNNKHILIVDDEEQILHTFKVILSKSGYKVSTQNSSSMAFDLLASASNTFDLIITDQTMPEMTGIQLAKKLREHNITIPIILCTGFSKKITQQDLLTSGISEMILKPVTKTILENAINKVFSNNYKEIEIG